MAKRPYRINPRVARERAALGGKASQTIDAYITRIVNRAPELTPAQRDRLAVVLRTGRTPGEQPQDAA
jgi:hypothetical protein